MKTLAGYVTHLLNRNAFILAFPDVPRKVTCPFVASANRHKRDLILTILTVTCSFLLFAIYCGTVCAQSIVGSINGTITDVTGSVIPGATVSATNSATGLTRSTSADSSGSYTVSALTPGAYRVRIQAPGFQIAITDNVRVTQGAITRVNVALKVGGATQSVTVNAAAQVLQTTSASVNSLLAPTALSNFPISASLNFESALILVPGVTPPASAHSFSSNPSRGLAFNTNGAFTSANNVRIDGAEDINAWLPGLAAYSPGLDAISSVSVTTNSYDAEQGLVGGANVNVHVKTGGDAFHGSLYEDYTGNSLSAKPFFLPPLFTSNPKNVENTLGGTIGGPLLKKRHVFFFFSYGGWFISQTASTLTTVPTAAMRGGDFSGSSTPIYDPLTGTSTGAGKTAFTNNQVLPARQDKIALAIQQSIPLPNLPNAGISNNYYATGPFTVANSTYDGDVTWKATPKLDVEARYGQLHYRDYDGAVFGVVGPAVSSSGGRQGPMWGETYNSTASTTYVFSPNLVSNGFFTATISLQNGTPLGLGTDVGQTLGIPGTNNGPISEYGGWPYFSVSNFTAFGNGSVLNFNIRDNLIEDTIMWTHKSHTFSFGANVQRQILDFFQASISSINGTFNFTGSGTTVAGGPGANAYNSYADFLLGVFSTGQSEFLPQNLVAKYFEYSMFAEDHWNVSRRLALSTGLRWDHFPIGGRDGRGYERYIPYNNTMMICGVAGNPHDCGYAVSVLDFSPSLGITYELTPSLVVRAGAGLNRDPYPLANNRDMATNFPNDLTETLTSPTSTTTAGTLETGLPKIVPFDISSGFVPVPSSYTVRSLLDHNERDYVETWNLSIQKKWGSDLMTQAAYVGSRQVKAPALLNENAAGILGGGTASEPYNIKFGRTATTSFSVPFGHNQYDGLQLQAKESIGANYSLDANYAWSKSFSQCCDGTYGETVAINTPGYYRLNRALAPTDETYIFTAFGTAKLPFGKQQRLLTSGVPAAIAGGWQMSGVLEAYAGTPFSVSASGSSLNAPGDTQMADRVKKGSCIQPGYRGPTASYVDASCFAAVTAVRFGNAGFENVRGPGVKDLNATLKREFNIRDRVQFELRGDVFNVTNTPHFSNPSANISVVTFNPDHSVAKLGGFGALSSTNSRDQEGIDQRFFRVGAHITF